MRFTVPAVVALSTGAFAAPLAKKATKVQYAGKSSSNMTFPQVLTAQVSTLPASTLAVELMGPAP